MGKRQLLFCLNFSFILGSGDLLSSAWFDFALGSAGAALGHERQFLLAEDGFARMARRRRVAVEPAPTITCTRRLQQTGQSLSQSAREGAQQLVVVRSSEAEDEQKETANGDLRRFGGLQGFPSRVELELHVLDESVGDERRFLSAVVVAVPAERRFDLKDVALAVQWQVRQDNEGSVVHFDALNGNVRLVFAVQSQTEIFQVLLFEGLDGYHDVRSGDWFDADEPHISHVTCFHFDGLARRQGALKHFAVSVAGLHADDVLTLRVHK